MSRLKQGLATLDTGRTYMTSGGEQLFGGLPVAAGEGGRTLNSH